MCETQPFLLPNRNLYHSLLSILFLSELKIIFYPFITSIIYIYIFPQLSIVFLIYVKAIILMCAPFTFIIHVKLGHKSLHEKNKRKYRILNRYYQVYLAIIILRIPSLLFTLDPLAHPAFRHYIKINGLSYRFFVQSNSSFHCILPLILKPPCTPTLYVPLTSFLSYFIFFGLYF